THKRVTGWLHTSELQDGYDWGRLSLRSVTEQSSLEEFLATAELAGTEFVAGKVFAIVETPPDMTEKAGGRTGLLTAEEARNINKLHEENRQFLCIPRRPYWDRRTSAENLQQAERESFLQWRRQLARLEEEQKLILTPFERNLDFWRQLWRVIERSDIVVQIVDARNPLLFRCQDLECYVKEISSDKENVILINKADLLSTEQRRAWAQFFEREGVTVVFWSALAEGVRLGAAAKLDMVAAAEAGSGSEDGRSSEEEEDGALQSLGNAPDSSVLGSADESEAYEDCEEEAWQTCSEDGSEEGGNPTDPGCRESRTAGALAQCPAPLQSRPVRNFSHLVQRHELLQLFRTMHAGKKEKEGEVTVGLVGYPNVGKSSTINTILGNKKVSVSATPGHTKHFQTLYVEPGLCLCDCPGLVMPSFVSTKAEMVCCGVLPIDQMRDHVPPISLTHVCQRVPRHVLEGTYGINIIRPREDKSCSPRMEFVLLSTECMRGFMTAHGQPDQPRSARYVLKDYVSGKLLYCHPPPGIDPGAFQHQHDRYAPHRATQAKAERKPERNQKAKQIENVVDKTFFQQESVRALTRGVQTVMGYKPGSGPVSQAASGSENVQGKPWKKHGNRNKKEKVRRVSKHLDA
uniref:Large subunit GTPase 1 homolog n=1 Tax=Pelodiscus sinensis TaxID=13735 RepID=K7FSE9_PELSI